MEAPWSVPSAGTCKPKGPNASAAESSSKSWGGAKENDGTFSDDPERRFARLLPSGERLYVERHWHASEILLGWERRNQSSLSGSRSGLLGFVVEQGLGFWAMAARHDLEQDRGGVFARIESRLLNRLRHALVRAVFPTQGVVVAAFPIVDSTGSERGRISCRYPGYIKARVSEANSFEIDFGPREWTLSQRAVVFAAAVNIDFDFFYRRGGE